MSLINCKVHLELNWTKDCVMSDNNNNNTEFELTNTNLYKLIVTLLTEYNVKLIKQINEGFKRPVYWNQCKRKVWLIALDHSNLLRTFLDAYL